MNDANWFDWFRFGPLSAEGAALLGILGVTAVFSPSFRVRALPFFGLSFLGVACAVFARGPWPALVGLGVTLLAQALDGAVGPGAKTERGHLLSRLLFSLSAVVVAATGFAWREAGDERGIPFAVAGLLLSSAPYPFFSWGIANSEAPFHRRGFWGCVFSLTAAWSALVALESDAGFLAASRPAIFLIGGIAALHAWFAFFRDGGARASWILLPLAAFWTGAFALGSGGPEAGTAWWTGFLLAAAAIQLWWEGVENSRLSPRPGVAQAFWALALAAAAGAPIFLSGYGASLSVLGWEQAEAVSIAWLIIHVSFVGAIARHGFAARAASLPLPSARTLVGALLLLLSGGVWLWKGSLLRTGIFPLFGQGEGGLLPAPAALCSLAVVAFGFVGAYPLRKVEGPGFFRTGGKIKGSFGLRAEGVHRLIRAIEHALESVIWEKWILQAVEASFGRTAFWLERAGEVGLRCWERGASGALGLFVRTGERLRPRDAQTALLLGCAWLALLALWVRKG